MSIAKTSIVPLVAASRVSGRSVAAQLLSAFVSSWRERARGSPPLDDHLRRDIGLPPIERNRDWWNIR